MIPAQYQLPIYIISVIGYFFVEMWLRKQGKSKGKPSDYFLGFIPLLNSIIVLGFIIMFPISKIYKRQ